VLYSLNKNQSYCSIISQQFQSQGAIKLTSATHMEGTCVKNHTLFCPCFFSPSEQLSTLMEIRIFKRLGDETISSCLQCFLYCQLIGVRIHSNHDLVELLSFFIFLVYNQMTHILYIAQLYSFVSVDVAVLVLAHIVLDNH